MADHRVKSKESEKRDKFLDLARELTKTMEYVSDGGTIPKGIVKGLEDLKITGQIETTQKTALLRSARILRRVLETLGDLSFQ